MAKQIPDPFEKHPIPTVCCICCLALVIVIVNIATVILHLRKANSQRNKKKSTLKLNLKHPVDYIILALLFSNILQGLVTLPAYALKKWKVGSKDVEAAICDTFRFSYFLCLHLLIFISVLSSFDQIIAVILPFRHMKIFSKCHIFAAVVGIVSVSLMYNILPFFPIAEKENEKCSYVPFKGWGVANLIIQLILLAILLINSIYLTSVAYKHTLHSRTKGRMVADNYKWYEMMKLKATRTVIMMITAYIICWGPLIIYYLLVWLCQKCFPASYMTYDQWTRFLVKVLGMLYSLWSPIIFATRTGLIRKRKQDMGEVSCLELSGRRTSSVQNSHH